MEHHNVRVWEPIGVGGQLSTTELTVDLKNAHRPTNFVKKNEKLHASSLRSIHHKAKKNVPTHEVAGRVRSRHARFSY